MISGRRIAHAVLALSIAAAPASTQSLGALVESAQSTVVVSEPQ